MAKNNNLTDFLTDTANAIRTKKGTTGKINPQDFSSEIASIQTGTDTSDATATADDILLGKTAYAKGEKLTGTIETYAGEGGETVSKLAALVDGSLTEITAEDLAGATKIIDYAFYSYRTIISVILPNSVTKIGSSAFRSCTSLTSVIINNGVTSIGGDAFNGCTSLISVTIPNSVESMSTYVFYGCSKLTSITIPNSVRGIADYMFYNCSSLTNIIISNNAAYINNAAFYGCSKLTSITIPNSVTRIDPRALWIGSSTNKATITMLRTTPPTIYSDTFYASYLQKIIVPAGTGATYKAATNWSNFADYIEEATA